MKVKVLGCSGGIGGLTRGTTSLLVDADTLIDCGTGLASMDLPALFEIDQIFLTHSHLDHIALLPMLVDTVGDGRVRPITVYALEETLCILRAHIFNWLVWPDFTSIPDRSAPYLQLQAVRIGDVVDIGGGRTVTVLPATHTVPAAGYSIGCAAGSLAFTGDTAVSAALVEAINRILDLRYLLIETAFPDSQQDLALAARHLCPVMLHSLLKMVNGNPEVYVTHLKPVFEAVTAEDVFRYQGRLTIDILKHGQELDLSATQTSQAQVISSR